MLSSCIIINNVDGWSVSVGQWSSVLQLTEVVVARLARASAASW